ncbi:MAG: DUF1553 domain-containing protein [Planctomycetota bacterium]
MFCLGSALRAETTPLAEDSHAQGNSKVGITFFESKIRPVLAKHCNECHSADAKHLRGGLLLDSREAMLAGGDSGPAIVPGNADESLLIQALKHEGFEMPPTGKLPAGVIKDFETWIAMGAPDPRTSNKPTPAKRTIDLEAGRQFWSFRPPVKHEPPKTKDNDWPRGWIDRFLLARLEREGLAPAKDADRRTLLRRVTFDLTGLPPTIEEMESFLQDDSPDAFERIVDRLLASPRLGERWGRHWLDVARYADSTGGGRSMIFETSWHYRDYVIDAFNQDKPFDRFILEQLAGDLLPYEDYRQGRRQLVATAFLALGPTNYEEQDKTQLEMDVIDEQIDTTGRAFLGMTLGCARCHDHKFDPIPTTDYYALAGIFRSTHTLNHDNVSTWVKRKLPMDEASSRAFAEYESKVARLDGALKETEQKRKRLQSLVAAVTIDDDDASFSGNWVASTSVKPYVGRNYRYASGDAAAVYKLDDRIEPGRYSVRVAYTPHANRSKRTLVTVAHAGGETSVRIDQTQTPTFEGLYVDVGAFQFAKGKGNKVTIGTNGADHIVVTDAVQLVPLDKKKPGMGERVVADITQLAGIVVDDSAAELTGEWIQSTFHASYVRGGYVHDDNMDKGKKSIRYRVDVPKSGEYEVRFSYTHGASRATRVPINIAFDGGDETVYINEREKPAVDGLFTRLGTYRFANDQTAIVTVSNEGTSDGHVVADAIQFVPASEVAAEAATTPESEASTDTASGDLLARQRSDLDRDFKRLKEELATLKKTAPPAPTEVIGVEEGKEIADCELCIRGEIKNRGPKVPRGFVSVATQGPMPTLAANASGRLELAHWIASPQNPLTARVFVNRVWSHLFGAGLVRTVDQFGATGEAPSHPELLDTLAVRFVEEGWSLKKLIREIVLTHAYQMSSERSKESRSKDPANRWLAGQNRRRLDAEALYDSMLALSGSLDLTMGGPTIREGTKSEYGYSFDVGRRAVYLPVFRNRLHDLMAVFDFPDPNLSLGQRNTSTISTQALYLMNSPFVMDQAKVAAAGLLKDSTLGNHDRITMLFQRALGRPPREEERRLVAVYLAEEAGTDETSSLKRWSNVCQTVIASIDFRYLD